MKLEDCRVAISDDEDMIRYALRSVIKSFNMNCVGEATSN